MWNTLKERAREHRNNPTEAEEILWQAIRSHQLGYEFRRQQAIHVYIADFVCLDLKLIIEVDGGYHEEENQQFIDAQRTNDLNALGYRIVRFTNKEIIENLANVIQQLQSYIAEAQVPRPNGEGDLGGGAQNFSYIMGNPPFVGARWMGKEQKQDVLDIFGTKWNGVGDLDYVCCWYKKACDYIKGTNINCAFVSTNSITQGGSVTNLWKPLIDDNVKINFAYRTFRWDSEASIKAHVHCVIIGFSYVSVPFKNIYVNEQTTITTDNINGYLLNAPNIFIEKRLKPICSVPEICLGGQPIDDGNLILLEAEKNELEKSEPQSAQFIRPFMMGKDFIDRKPRYCLWLKDAPPSILKNCPLIRERVTKVREFRQASNRTSTLRAADNPSCFGAPFECQSDYIALPKVSSENRKYIPIDYLSKDIIPGDKLFCMQNASLYHFGILNSNVHMAWMRAVCGRLEMRYSYSNTIVYNNFPWPTPTEAQNAKIEKTAQAILDARALYPDSSLADLYDEVTMPPELRKAHQNNDRAVMEAYGFDWRNMSESECVAELFKLYQKLVEAEQSQGEAKPKRARKKS